MIKMETVQEILQQFDIFNTLKESELGLLSRQAVNKKMEKGEALVLQGDNWPYFFLVLDGELVALKESIEGRNLVITTFRKGDVFWGSSFFQDDAPQLATLQANAPTVVLLWSRKRIEPVFKQNGELSWKLCQMMMLRMQRASAIVNDLAFLSVSSRLAHLLLENFSNNGEESMERSLTLDDMAARIGTTREMVCRVLYRFADKNFIKVTRTEFVLTDREGLSGIVECK